MEQVRGAQDSPYLGDSSPSLIAQQPFLSDYSLSWACRKNSHHQHLPASEGNKLEDWLREPISCQSIDLCTVGNYAVGESIMHLRGMGAEDTG